MHGGWKKVQRKIEGGRRKVKAAHQNSSSKTQDVLSLFSQPIRVSQSTYDDEHDWFVGKSKWTERWTSTTAGRGGGRCCCSRRSMVDGVGTLPLVARRLFRLLHSLHFASNEELP